MAPQVLVAHTGQRLQVDFSQLSSIDDFKTLVSRQTSIPLEQMVLLNTQGKGVKFQSIRQEPELYVYDRQISRSTGPDSKTPPVHQIPNPKQYGVPKAPDYIDNTHEMSAWQKLCLARRSWALRIRDDCSQLASETQDRYTEMDVMIKCLDAIVTNMEHSVKQIEPKYAELKGWLTPTLEEQARLAGNWEQYLALARDIPISSVMVRFMTSKNIKGNQATLDELVDLDTAKKAGSLAPTSARKLRSQADNLDKSARSMNRELETLMNDFETLISRSALSHSNDAAQLLEDISAVAKKIDTDAQIVQGYGNTQRDLSQASKTAQNHTERLLPTLKKRAMDLDEMLHYATQARNSVATEAARMMRNISDMTELHSTIKSQIHSLNQSEGDMTTFDYLRLIHQLPYMYASYVVESIRRRAWADKIKTDSSTLANEMALFQDEETRRRKKWQTVVGNTYGPDDFTAAILGLEVNLLGEEAAWPDMTKAELEEFLDHLKRRQTDEQVVEEVRKLLDELNSPTKQQSKRVKAFKNGSVHEAALGRSGLMIRGDEDLLRNLQSDKSKLENKLKTAESRVRRLEDLLHRNHAPRPSLGSLFGHGHGHERAESTHSLKSTPASEEQRRLSAGSEALQQRIQQLEAELNSEKERSAVFEKDLNAQATQHNDIKGRMEEINSTKKDLLGNMEALKREFDEERKSLEDEIRNLKARIEDNEDEMEHLGASREHEKTSYDDKIQALEREVGSLQKEKADGTQKFQGQVEFLRNEARLQRDQIQTLEKQLQTAHDEAKLLSKDLVAAKQTGGTQYGALKDLLQLLSPSESLPEDLVDLTESLLSRADEVVSNLKGAESDISVLRADLDKSQAQVKTLRAEIAQSKDKVDSQENDILRLQEHLAEEKARVLALEKDAEDSRGQLSQLRSKIADGETGSESLRKRLQDEEQQLTSMVEELASRQSQVGSLEEELHMFKEKLRDAQGKLSVLTDRFDGRSDRSKDLTQRLYTQNERLFRLLERLGYAVTREQNSMAIQRIPRSERGSTSQLQNANDSSDPGASSLRRSTTISSRTMADSTELELLYWTNTEDAEEEAEKYDSFVSTLGYFDMDKFVEVVSRRVKDLEHVARKLQRDVRSYREKARTTGKDAHEKIAYKNFKEGDLALFLPTRNQQSGAWAAFNVGCPHFFLREQDAHRLRTREWLVARITRIQERVVDLSKNTHKQLHDSESIHDEDDNPFQLSDGLRWYMIDAHEDKSGAPSTPGLGKSTIAATNVEARADMHSHAQAGGKDKQRASGNNMEGVSKVLSKSLESRRSSSTSKKALPFAMGGGGAASLLKGSALASETNSLRAVAPDTPTGASPPAHPTSPLAASSEQARGQSSNAAKQDLAQTQARARQPQTQGDKGSSGSTTTEPPPQPAIPQREESGISVDSPSKRSVVWDSLWSMDVSYEGGRKELDDAAKGRERN